MNKTSCYFSKSMMLPFGKNRGRSECCPNTGGILSDTSKIFDWPMSDAQLLFAAVISMV